MRPIVGNSVRQYFSLRLLVVSTTLAFALIASEASASSVTLVGVNGSGATATVSNYSLVGNVFSFDLTNTSATGFITNIAVAIGDIVDATSYTTTAPFTYTIIHDGATPPDGPGLPANDFFLLPPSQLTGINPGQSYLYQISLTMDGSPLAGITADMLASGVEGRVVGLPTQSGRDLVAAVPEPTSFLLLAGGLGLAALRRRLKKHA